MTSVAAFLSIPRNEKTEALANSIDVKDATPYAEKQKASFALFLLGQDGEVMSGREMKHIYHHPFSPFPTRPEREENRIYKIKVASQ